MSRRTRHSHRDSWSISRRTTVWFAVRTSLLVALLAVVSTWSVRAAIERELEALCEEELEEFGVLFTVSERDPAAFRDIAAELAAKHPSNPMVWRVWDPDTGEAWGEVGDAGLLRRADPPLRPSPSMRAYDDTLRWKSAPVDGGLAVGLLIECEPQLKASRLFGLIALVFVPASGLLATIAGAILGRRIARLLRGVADDVRGIRDPRAEVGGDEGNPPTEIRDVADALREMLQNIHAEVEAARLITSGLAHELRSPIQNLLGETEVALLRERGSEEYRRVLKSNSEELRELARAVDNLVTLCAAGEWGRAEGRERFDLGREAELRLQREFAQAERRGIVLRCRCAKGLELSGDREALLLAIGNLVTNAIQWTAPGGHVDVLIHAANGHLEVVVDDEGPGVPPERHEEIFQPFSRRGKVEGRREGFGLGLALARTAVEAHGGRIEVGESPGSGARFRIVLQGDGASAPPVSPD